jgi:uncharacterized membrane protein
MKDVSLQLVVAMFESEEDTEVGLTALRQMKGEKKAGLHGAILINKDASGQQVHYKDIGLTPGKGALGGVVLGAAVGILTGGAGLVLGAAGAVLGGLVGRKKQDQRFDVDHLNQVGASLGPGGAAIVAVVAPDAVSHISDLLEQQGADLFATSVTADLAQELQLHRDEAYALMESKLDSDQSIDEA